MAQEAARAARERGLRTWAFTGRRPSPLADAVDETFAVDVEATATVQEVHQVAIHLLCEAVDAAFARPAASRRVRVQA